MRATNPSLLIHPEHLSSFAAGVAASFCEQVIAPESTNINPVNVFGRKPEVGSDPSLATLLGTAITGLRSLAVLDAGLLAPQCAELTTFTRLHVPLTVVATGNASAYLPEFAGTGSVVLYASDAEELASLILIAQVLSEKSLRPVVVIAGFEANDPLDLNFIQKWPVKEWLGDPDRRVPDPTKAQTMVLGAVRRRMPAWIHNDNPVFVGAARNHRDMGNERAASYAFEDAPLQSMIDSTFESFRTMFGSEIATEWISGSKRMKEVLLTPIPSQTTRQTLQSLPALTRGNTTLIGLRQLFPAVLPPGIKASGIETVQVLEPMVYNGSQGFMFKEWSAMTELESSKRQNGWFASTPDIEGYEAAIENLRRGDKGKRKFWLDVAMGAASSSLPKYDLLLQEIRRSFPEAERLSLLPQASLDPQGSLPQTVPVSIRKFDNTAPPYARPARFRDHVAALYENGNGRAVTDPFQAFPVMPISTAALFASHNPQQQYPVFKATACTGCLQCLSACPHAALPAVAITIDELLKAGMDIAKSQGTVFKSLPQVIRTWSKIANEQTYQKTSGVSHPAHVLTDAFEEALLTISDAEKQASLREEYKALMKAIVGLPLAATELLFKQQHKRSAGNGLLFTLAPDLNACTGCGFCAEACTDGALSMEVRTADGLAALSTGFDLFSALPDTPALAIEHLQAQQEPDPIDALMLSSKAYHAFSGPSEEVHHVAAKSMLRTVSALCRHSLSINNDVVDEEIGKHITAIKSAIKKELSDGMPLKRLDSLLVALNNEEQERLGIDKLMENWGREEDFKSIDKRVLHRKLALIDDLERLRTALKTGTSGNGRAPYTVVLDHSLSHFGTYPRNHFDVPVVCSTSGAAPATALGVMKGVIRHVTDNVRLLRRATLEAAGKYIPADHDEAIANLDFADLQESERALITPVVILGTRDMLVQTPTAAWHRLLDSGWPIKVIAINDASLALDASQAAIHAADGLNWTFMASGVNVVASATASDTAHLYKVANKALKHPLPALLNIIAPEPAHFHILPQRWAQAATAAVSTRAATPFIFDPDAGFDSFSMRMDLLDGRVDSDWNKTEIEYSENGETQKLDYTLTWADWAFLMRNRREGFAAMEDTEYAVDVATYLGLPVSDRKGKVPFIARLQDDGSLQRYAVNDEVISVCETVRARFRIFREWSGLLSEHPEKLKALVMEELSAGFEKDKRAFEQELLKEKAGWEEEHLARLKQQVKEKLMKMAGQS